jgi:hypothetical protein
VMFWLPSILLAGAVAASAPSAAAPAPRELYRVELAGSQVMWSLDRPKQTGGLIVFHRYPDGVLLSIRGTAVRRIVLSKFQSEPQRALSPGGVIDLGMTGGSAGKTTAGARPSPGGTAPPLGARKDGTALLNPDRAYRPDWDTKQVPGLNIPYPASSNDYREGKTFAYPPAAAYQSQPGDVPRAQVETGEPPKPPDQ